MRAETPTSLVNQMSATRPHARTNSYFQDEDTGRFTSEVISTTPKGGEPRLPCLMRLASTTWYDKRSSSARTTPMRVLGNLALNAVHEFGDSQIETLGEDVERIQTGLLRSVFQSVKKCSIQPGML